MAIGILRSLSVTLKKTSGGELSDSNEHGCALLRLMRCRNIGILCGFLVGLFLAYVAAAETARPPKNKGEVLVFRRGKHPTGLSGVANGDVESQHELIPLGHDARATPNEPASHPGDRPVFHWNDICYDVDIKGQTRRILSQVDGWVQPGKSTALMVCQSQLCFPTINSQADMHLRVSQGPERQHYSTSLPDGSPQAF